MPPNLRTSDGMSLQRSAPSDPEHSVMQFAGESTMPMSRCRSSWFLTIRGRPKIGRGGSSGCIAILTPTSSATGMIRFRKYSRFCHSRFSSTDLYSASRVFNSSG